MSEGAAVSFKKGPHRWLSIQAASRSGKSLWECSLCGLRSPAPLKDEYETRECEPGKWDDTYRQPDGTDWPPSWERKG